MAYQTGSAANLTELLDAIRLFAIGQGWTVDRWTSGSALLFLSKGQCFVTMRGTTRAFTDFTTGSGVAANEGILRMAIGTANNPALTTFWGHPGSIVTSETDGDRIEINDLTGPFPSYHFFSDAAVSDYIHVVVQSTAERWQHFSFGNLDKGGFTHAGVGYATGTNRLWYRADADGTPGSIWHVYNDISKACVAFASNGDQNLPLSTTVRLIHAPDAMPNNATAWPIVQSGLHAHLRLLGISSPANFPRNNPNTALLNAFIASPISQWSGQAMLWAIPAIVVSGVVSSLCYIGDYPNVRLLSMEGMTPQQEIALGGDVWKVFPVGRQTSWGTKAQLGFQFSTGHVALAYKKVT